MLSVIALIVLPYLAFVFFAESFNIFSKPKNLNSRSRWKLGRSVSLSVFVGSCCALLLLNFSGLSQLASVIVGVMVAMSLSALFLARKISGLLRS